MKNHGFWLENGLDDHSDGRFVCWCIRDGVQFYKEFIESVKIIDYVFRSDFWSRKLLRDGVLSESQVSKKVNPNLRILHANPTKLNQSRVIEKITTTNLYKSARNPQKIEKIVPFSNRLRDVKIIFQNKKSSSLFAHFDPFKVSKKNRIFIMSGAENNDPNIDNSLSDQSDSEDEKPMTDQEFREYVRDFEFDRNNPRGVLEFEVRSINLNEGEKPFKPKACDKRDFTETVMGLEFGDVDLIDFFPRIEDGKFDGFLRLKRWATHNFDFTILRNLVSPKWMKFGFKDDSEVKTFEIQFRKCNMKYGSKLVIQRPMFKPFYLDDHDKPEVKRFLETAGRLVLMKDIMDDKWHANQIGGRGIKKGNWIAWIFPGQEVLVKEMI